MAKPITFAFALIAVLAGVAAPRAASAEIGVLAAVNRDMTGARPAEAARPVFIRERLVTNERLVTSADGGGQVLFLDQTSLTVSPNSDLVLDRYVFDPDAQTGEIGVSLARGALRMVGGRITKTAAATVNTPTATIGIRGGISQTVVEGDGSALHFHFAGISSTISTSKGALTITREGGYARIGADGSIEYLGIATPQALAAALAGGAGKGDGGAGGGGNAAGGIGQVAALISGAPGAVETPAITTTGARSTYSFDVGYDPALETPSDEFQSGNLDEDVLPPPVDPDLNGILFNGAYNFTATTLEQGAVTGSGTFFMNFVVASGQGIFVADFPASLQPDFQGQGGGDRIADTVIVVRDGDRLVTDPVGISGLFGATDGEFTISATDSLNGGFTINYNGNPFLTNVQVLSGEVVEIGGVQIDLADFDTVVNNFRDALQEFVDFNNQ